MADLSATRASLLVRIRDAKDGPAWERFVEVYGPLIYGFGRRHGLQDADAADLTQEVLRVVPAAVRRLDYDPDRGSFRGWLFTIVRNELRTLLSRQRRPGQGSGDTGVNELLAAQPGQEGDPAALWDEEVEQRLFSYAAEQVRGQVQASTWQAFWQTAVQGAAAQEVATRLEMTVAAVYLAKSRVMARLREQIRQLQGE
jgi:RNA polymerase sigma-70 factor (ECF subfamily)